MLPAFGLFVYCKLSYISLPYQFFQATSIYSIIEERLTPNA